MQSFWDKTELGSSVCIFEYIYRYVKNAFITCWALLV